MRTKIGSSAIVVASAALLAVGILVIPPASAQTPTTSVSTAAQTFTVYRVNNAVARANELTADGFDLLEERSGNDLFVLGDATTGSRLNQAGFTAQPVKVVTEPTWTPPPHHANNSRQLPSDVNETYDGGYHTVNAQYAHLDQVISQHPDLAKEVTYGQSWRKQQGQANGYDLKAICITKLATGDCALNPNSVKPRFLLYSQIHAREITTGDVAWRWIDYLVNNYGTDSTVTSLMNSTEMWVVPIANPDGVDIVQQGGDNPILQRKNADNSNGDCGSPTAFSQSGVDLNRNYNSSWGGASTSTDPCSQVYDGPRADSDPETTASEQLWRQLFPAVRGSAPTDPSPATAKGLMITMHTDASVVIFPWDYSHTVHTGNDAALRAIGGKLGSITGYQSGQAGEVLYDAAGDTDDWAYDKLGVASFTIEIGDNTGVGCDGFTPPYSCQTSYFWPKMQPALVYAAQQAAAPYKNG